ncbi:hypothetical protein AX15_006184 [Amanita polypyramis BW_CC]|nr:hypothetical protein AX15_006184 [Amanita polypyramis BW_CC]
MFKLFSNVPVIPKSLFITEVVPKINLDYISMGGFGCVFEGEYRGSQVALKILYKVRHKDVGECFLPDSLDADNCVNQESLIKGLCREALVWRSLSHRHILPLLGIYEEKSRLFLVSPYMKNETLSRWRSTHKSSMAEIQKRVCF